MSHARWRGVTKMVPWTVMVALLAGALAGPSTKVLGADQSVATEQCADRDRVGYKPISTRRLPGIKLERLSEQEVGQRLAPGATQSPYGTGRLAVEEPDMTKGGPWNTTVYAVTDSPRLNGVRMVLVDHGSGGVRATWMNEKLVFVRCGGGASEAAI